MLRHTHLLAWRDFLCLSGRNKSRRRRAKLIMNRLDLSRNSCGSHGSFWVTAVGAISGQGNRAKSTLAHTHCEVHFCVVLDLTGDAFYTCRSYFCFCNLGVKYLQRWLPRRPATSSTVAFQGVSVCFADDETCAPWLCHSLTQQYLATTPPADYVWSQVQHCDIEIPFRANRITQTKSKLGTRSEHWLAQTHRRFTNPPSSMSTPEIPPSSLQLLYLGCHPPSSHPACLHPSTLATTQSAFAFIQGVTEGLNVGDNWISKWICNCLFKCCLKLHLQNWFPNESIH